MQPVLVPSVVSLSVLTVLFCTENRAAVNSRDQTLLTRRISRDQTLLTSESLLNHSDEDQITVMMKYIHHAQHTGCQ